MSVGSINNTKYISDPIITTPPLKAIESLSIFKQISPFLVQSDLDSLEIVNKNWKDIVIATSKIVPHDDPIITDGYGDFVLLDSNGPVDAQTFKKAFEHMSALLPQVDQTPRSNRLRILNEKLQEIQPTLKAIFIPRTLYELCYILSAYREEVDVSSGVKKIGCKRQEDTDICWHSHKFYNLSWQDRYPLNPIVSELAFRLNQIIVKELQATTQGWTEGQCIKLGQSILKKSDKMHQAGIKLQQQGYEIEWRATVVHKGPLLGVDRLRQAISLECSQRAHNVCILYRGSRFIREPLFVPGGYPLSVSFGLSLLAGYFHDIGTCAADHMVDKKYNYALCVPFTDHWKDVFLVPAVTTLDGIMQAGEKSHARAKCVTKSGSGSWRIEMYEGGDEDDPEIRKHLVTSLATEIYQEKINKYQKARIEF